jgi:urease subunit alpha
VVCHNLNPKISSDIAFAESRVRGETIVAECVLHAMGAISMIGNDSQAMGRSGESFLGAFQTADAMKKARGKLPEDAAGNDNFRQLRYLAKVTINPIIAAGMSDVLGSIAAGRVADRVLWDPGFFAVKPKLVLKGVVFTVIMQGALDAALAPVAIPTFAVPLEHFLHANRCPLRLKML